MEIRQRANARLTARGFAVKRKEGQDSWAEEGTLLQRAKGEFYGGKGRSQIERIIGEDLGGKS